MLFKNEENKYIEINKNECINDKTYYNKILKTIGVKEETLRENQKKNIISLLKK